jgi:uncharacterized protein YigA (DUF484 family)
MVGISATTNVTDVLAELRAVIDQREELAKQDRELAQRRSELERQLMQFHEHTGLENCAGAGLTVRFNPAAMRCRYEPDRWQSIVRWAVETGNDHIIQRRTSDAKVIELVQHGVALPEGLTLESYTDISIRRK